MKKKGLLFALCSVAVLCASAQTISITGLGGYNFRDKVNFGNAYGYVNEGGFWGVSVEGINPRGKGIELLYQQQTTHTPLYYYAFPNVQINPNTDKTTVSYLMLSAMHHILSGTIQPYGGIGLGAAFISPQQSSTETRFAWNARLGVKFKATPLVGIKIQAQLFSIVDASGSSFYVAPGALVVSSYSSVYQFGFSGGICFDLDKSMKNK